jgi:DNA-binding GntR family transcriptional regulator
MTMRHAAYQAIKNKIIFFELKSGDKVLESKMARLLKFGRVPVREALTMLESEGLIVKTRGYGYFVTHIRHDEIEDYFNIRTQLECLGATLFMERATAADIRHLRDHLNKAEAVYQKDNIRKIILSDTKFHDLMYQATKSEVFFRTISSLADKTIIMRAAALHTEEGRSASLKDHREIMAAIEARDPDRLQNLIRDHMKYAPRYYDAIRPVISI